MLTLNVMCFFTSRSLVMGVPGSSLLSVSMASLGVPGASAKFSGRLYIWNFVLVCVASPNEIIFKLKYVHLASFVKLDTNKCIHKSFTRTFVQEM